MSRAERKQAYFQKLGQLLSEYPKILIVGADNVGSSHMQKIRKNLRGKAVLLMGKNTMVRKAIRGFAETNAKLQVVLPYVKGNVGLVFAKDDLSSVKKIISENKVAAPAKVGAVAPSDVIIPAGPTGMEPTQTSFLQALNIASKISKGQVDIISDVKIISAGQRVGSSESTLLAKLNIKPFQYGLIIQTVYDEGSIYSPAVLDMTDDDLLAKFRNGVKNVACVSLATKYPTIAALPHVVTNGFKNVLSVALAVDYSFPKVDLLKKAIANPVAAPAAAPAVTTASKKTEEKPKKEEPKEEEDDDMGLGLFD
jgi:large subunit ribosomal protein LP0